MGPIKVGDNYYVIDELEQVDPSWPDGTIVAVRDPDFIAKYYTVTAGVPAFLYNQNEQRSQQQLLRSKITVGTSAPPAPQVNDVWIDTN